MRAILAVIKKELKSILTNRTILAQIILIPFLYVFGFTMLMTTMNPTPDTPDSLEIKGYYINLDGELAAALDDLGMTNTSADQLETLKDQMRKEECDIIVMFPDNFLKEQTEMLPDVQMWYDSSSENSYKAFVVVSGMLESLNPKIFTINADANNVYDLMDEGKTIREMLGMIFSTYMLIAVIIASQGLAADSIAGDKERGFLNMLLLTPVKRHNIAIGKSLSLLIVNAISTISAFAAMALSLPKFSESFNLAVAVSYTAIDYINLFILIVSATTVLLSLMLLISTLASSIKQASSMSGVVMIIVMLCSILMGSGMDFTEQIMDMGITNAYIPVWNSIIGIQKVFTQTLPTNMTLIALGINTAITILILSVIAKLFTSEKIVNNVSN